MKRDLQIELTLLIIKLSNYYQLEVIFAQKHLALSMNWRIFFIWIRCFKFVKNTLEIRNNYPIY